MSATSAELLVAMISNGDVKALSALPKVGKKIAEQLVLTLKNKLDKVEMSPAIGSKHEIVSALCNLGFRMQDVEKVVRALPADSDLHQGIRQGLQALSSL